MDGVETNGNGADGGDAGLKIREKGAGDLGVDGERRRDASNNLIGGISIREDAVGQPARRRSTTGHGHRQCRSRHRLRREPCSTPADPGNLTATVKPVHVFAQRRRRRARRSAVARHRLAAAVERRARGQQRRHDDWRRRHRHRDALTAADSGGVSRSTHSWPWHGHRRQLDERVHLGTTWWSAVADTTNCEGARYGLSNLFVSFSLTLGAAILCAASVVATSAQSPAPAAAAPVTGVLVSLTIKAGADRSLVAKTMPAEVRDTVQAYLDGEDPAVVRARRR